MTENETICAPATAPVNATLAIIRMSGPASGEIVHSVFPSVQEFPHRKAVYATLFDDGVPLDDVVVTYYCGPGSFTGEDMAEISCHGNALVVKKIIALLQKKGCRMAEPGEFSRRAFLNGKIDLTEAEAINQIIRARSDWEIETAVRQMHGSLRRAIDGVKEKIIFMKADIEASIDFVEEDINFAPRHELIAQIDTLVQDIETILHRSSVGQKMSRGIDMAIIGMPNVGKSSLLNMIVNEERAIVSDIPGTTRDSIRESVLLANIPINIIDTAGINVSDDRVEQLGIEQSYRYISTASLLLCIFDGCRPLTEDEIKLYREISDKRVIPVINKSDSADTAVVKSIEDFTGGAVMVSALTGGGLENLEQAIAQTMSDEFADYATSYIADARILQLLDRSLVIAREVRILIIDNEPYEIIASHLMLLISKLSEITGEIAPDDILGSIFSRFCIGK